MAKVAAAPGARDLDSVHAKAEILVKLDGSPSDWLEEAGPAGARVVLRLRTEQLRSARRAAIGPAILRERVFAGESVLSSLVPEHLELFRAQAPSPLLLGARELLLAPLPALDLLVHHASLDADLTPGSGNGTPLILLALRATLATRATFPAGRRRSKFKMR